MNRCTFHASNTKKPHIFETFSSKVVKLHNICVQQHVCMRLSAGARFQEHFKDTQGRDKHPSIRCRVKMAIYANHNMSNKTQIADPTLKVRKVDEKPVNIPQTMRLCSTEQHRLTLRVSKRHIKCKHARVQETRARTSN